MAAAMYNALLNQECSICSNGFEDGAIIRFYGPCFVHPLHSNCCEEWLQNQPFDNCPNCSAQLTDHFEINMTPWHTRGAVDFPALNMDLGVQIQALVGKTAPCCDHGFIVGDYIVETLCGSLAHPANHYMHAWCFLINLTQVDGDSIELGPPFNCFTCNKAVDDDLAFCSMQLNANESDDSEDGGDEQSGDSENVNEDEDEVSDSGDEDDEQSGNSEDGLEDEMPQENGYRTEHDSEDADDEMHEENGYHTRGSTSSNEDD